jgi:DNA-binding NtrC family response regulator
MSRPGPVDARTLSLQGRDYSFSRFRLAVIRGPDQGTEHDSEVDECSIGTSEGNQLVLSDRSVSRHHCVIRSAASGPLLLDLGSTNGTQLSGVRVEAAYLTNGATIEIGKTALRFELLEERITEPIGEHARYGRVLGQSAAMRRIFAAVERIAPTDSTILLEGETGVGKTLFADVIHQNSRRADGPFIVVDCGAIPHTLIESELFGHERGAFTGAHTARMGAFEAARGGTIFLDEVGELPLSLQPKLLRALEERQVKRIGSTQQIDLDIRLIAATNRELRAAVNLRTFRSDLYYRLNTVRVRIPPLRERREDIPALVEHFYRQFSEDDDPAPPAELIERLFWQPWLGNVRELRSAVERAVLLNDPDLWDQISGGGEVAPPDLGVDFDEGLSYRATKERAVARFERWYVSELIKRNEGNLSRAARAARMDRTHLRELLRRHRIAPPSERE